MKLIKIMLCSISLLKSIFVIIDILKSKSEYLNTYKYIAIAKSGTVRHFELNFPGADCVLYYSKSKIVTARSGDPSICSTQKNLPVPDFVMNIDLDLVNYSDVDFRIDFTVNILFKIWSLEIVQYG